MMKEFNLGNMFEGMDLHTLRTIDGLQRYKFNLAEGTIWDEKQQKYLNPKANDRGYCFVNLQRDDNSRLVTSVHHLILLAALQYDYRKLFRGLNMVCDHRNRIRSDNRATNLKPTTQSKNLRGREYKPVRLNDEQLEQLYADFNLIKEAKHGSKHSAYQMLSDKYGGYSAHSIQMRYLEYKRQQSA